MTAITLKQQIQEMQEEVELWKAIEANKYLKNSSKQTIISSFLL